MLSGTKNDTFLVSLLEKKGCGAQTRFWRNCPGEIFSGVEILLGIFAGMGENLQRESSSEEIIHGQIFNRRNVPLKEDFQGNIFHWGRESGKT